MLKATVNSRSFKLQLRGLVANAKRADLGRWSGLLANARRDSKERSFRSMLKLGDGKSALSASGVEFRDFVS